MPEIEVKNLKNEVVETLALSDEVFKAKVNRSLVWEAVKHYLANQRQGTVSTKGRAEVSGSGKKLWRQKGTGRARIGSIRSPLWRHGGTVHGPKPRDYSYNFPKKKLLGAMRSVLSERVAQNNLVVVDEFKLETPKTKEFKKVLDGFGFDSKLLIVDAHDNRNLYLSARNLPNVTVATMNSVNIYDLANHGRVLFSKSAILALQERLG